MPPVAAAHLLNTIIWNLPKKTSKRLYTFSSTASSSALEWSLAANLTSSDARAAIYVRHVQDARKHSEMFLHHVNDIRKEQGEPSLPHPRISHEALFNLLGEIRFLALIHHTKEKNTRRFSSYTRYFNRKGNVPLAALCNTILQDDIRHMNAAYELLAGLCGDKEAVRRELSAARLLDLRRRWMHAGRMLTGKLFFIITLPVYPLFLPYKLLMLRARTTISPHWSKL